MAETNAAPMIKVLGFKTTYERLPVRGGPLDDNLDEKGFRLDAKGKRVMENQEVDWVSYAPAHSPINTMNWERVRTLRVTEEMLKGEVTEKLTIMKMKWDQISPAYDAYKSGHEMPAHGTPLAIWPGVTPEKAEILRRYGIRSVEEVGSLVESQLEKIPLPGMRDLRQSAKIFLQNQGAAEAAARETERDNEIASQAAQIADLNERLSAAMELLERATAPQKGGENVDDLRAELDALGVKYHHKAGAETLKALLVEAKQGKAA